MTLIPAPAVKPLVHYPDSDGKRMAETTLQALWIMVLCGNLRWLFRGQNVFVAADLLWYPVDGEPSISMAPDVLVVFDRPDRHRGSYKQWDEDNIPVTVVFEILSPNNTHGEMSDKHAFYDQHGVEEYYEYHPESNRLVIWLRHNDIFRRVRPAHGFVSPRLGVRFDLSGQELVLYGPDGRPFLPLEGVRAERAAIVERAEVAERRAEEERKRAAEERKRAARLAELGRKARLGQATPEEMAELERLEGEALA